MLNEKEVLLKAVLEAGAAILHLQQVGFTVECKENNDILTQADLAANQIIKNHILDAFPQDGWLSEESVDDLSRLKKNRVWIIDPIDGTREFAKNIPEYAISVALVENGIPILAAIYNPPANELYVAEKGQGATLNHQKITCANQAHDKLHLLASRSEYNRGEWDAFMQHDIKVIGSIAYKLALVASGVADATFSLGPKNEWDIAAGVLLVQEAGGFATDKLGQPFVFNQPNTEVNGIVAASALLFPALMQLTHSP